MGNSKVQMKILSPIDRIEEALPLIEAGADEFFCGFVTEKKNFDSPRVAKITSCNIPNFDDFIGLVKLIKSKGKKIFVVMNSLKLDENKIKIIENIVNKLKKLKIDGVIISDLRLVDILKKAGINIVASSILEVKNEEAIKYMIHFGIKRIIFDRQITLTDIEIIKKYPQTEFETFVFYTGCRSLSGYCWRIGFKKNLMPNHFCCGKYKVTGKQNTKDSCAKINKKIIAERLSMPKYTCGACAMYQFKKIGITSLKIVGRGYATDKKIAAVKFIKKCLNLLDKFTDKKQYYQEVNKLHKSIFNEKCHRNRCYYPHFFN